MIRLTFPVVVCWVVNSTGFQRGFYVDFIIRSLERRCRVDAVYSDLSKAFDWIDHTRLLCKLRKKLCAASAMNSREIFTSSGATPCSILFNLFISDVQDCFINNNYLDFADDLKFFRTVTSSSDVKLLQDINRLIIA